MKEKGFNIKKIATQIALFTKLFPQVLNINVSI